MNIDHQSLARFRSTSRILPALAVLLGSLLITRVSHAQSATFTADLIAAGDTSGLLSHATAAQLDLTIKTEAGNSPIVTAGTFASDLNYVMSTLPAATATADYAGFITSLGNGISAPNFASQVTGITNAFATHLSDTVKTTLATDLSTVADKLDDLSSISTIASLVAGSLSAIDKPLDEGAVANHAAIPLATGVNKNLADVAGVANAVASLPGITLAEQAAIAQAFSLNGDYPTATMIATTTTVEQNSITNSGAALGVIAADFASDIPKYATNIAEYAATGKTAATAGLIGADVAAATNVPSSLAATLAFDVFSVAGGGTPADNLYAVASQFALKSGNGGPGVIPFTAARNIALTLVQAAIAQVPVTAGPDPASDQLVADIAAAFTEQISLAAPAGVLTAAQKLEIQSILTAVVAAIPNAGPDTLGRILASLPSSTGTIFRSTLKSAADNADTSAVAIAILEATYGNTYFGLTVAQAKTGIDAYITQANHTETTTTLYADGSVGSLNPDETPITNF